MEYYLLTNNEIRKVNTETLIKVLIENNNFSGYDTVRLFNETDVLETKYCDNLKDELDKFLANTDKPTGKFLIKEQFSDYSSIFYNAWGIKKHINELKSDTNKYIIKLNEGKALSKLLSQKDLKKIKNKYVSNEFFVSGLTIKLDNKITNNKCLG